MDNLNLNIYVPFKFSGSNFRTLSVSVTAFIQSSVFRSTSIEMSELAHDGTYHSGDL